EAPTLVLWTLSEELFALARIQAGAAAGRSVDELMRENRVWGPRQRPMKAAASRVRPQTVQRALAHAAGIDRAIKAVGPEKPREHSHARAPSRRTALFTPSPPRSARGGTRFSRRTAPTSRAPRGARA